MRGEERVYGWLLAAYPRRFRARYGGEMKLVFRDRRREVAARGGSVAGFWAEMLADLLRSAAPLRLEAVKAVGHTLLKEVGMVVMGILAIVVGVLESLGAGVEVRAAVQQGDWASTWLFGSSMGLAAGALLVGAGVSLLRRSPGAVPLARGAAITCIVVSVMLGWIIPMMGYFALLIGIGYPVALLSYLRRARGQWDGGDPTPA